MKGTDLGPGQFLSHVHSPVQRRCRPALCRLAGRMRDGNSASRSSGTVMVTSSSPRPVKLIVRRYQRGKVETCAGFLRAPPGLLSKFPPRPRRRGVRLDSGRRPRALHRGLRRVFCTPSHLIRFTWAVRGMSAHLHSHQQPGDQPHGGDTGRSSRRFRAVCRRPVAALREPQGGCRSTLAPDREALDGQPGQGVRLGDHAWPDLPERCRVYLHFRRTAEIGPRQHGRDLPCSWDHTPA